MNAVFEFAAKAVCCLCLVVLLVHNGPYVARNAPRWQGQLQRRGRYLYERAQGRKLVEAIQLADIPEHLVKLCKDVEPENRPSRCWVYDYLIFHRSMRNSPDAKYLVWVCLAEPRGLDNVYPHDCAGLGDRMRGIEYSMRLAYALKRVLLVHQEVPAPLQTFLLPNVLDWRITEDLNVKVMPGTRHLVLDNGTPTGKLSKQMLQDGSLEKLEDRVVTLATNYEMYATVGPTLGRMQYGDSAASDIPKVLFKMSPLLEERVGKALGSMGLRIGDPYIAVHLRMGGMLGEHERQVRHGLGANATTEDVIQRAETCALRLSTEIQAARRDKALLESSSSSGISKVVVADGKDADGKSPPIMLITDDTKLRTKAIAGELMPWVSPNVMPVHFSERDRLFSAEYREKHFDGDIEKHLDSMVDFGIMVHSTCLLYTISGFSMQASALRTIGCSTRLDWCNSVHYPNHHRHSLQ